MDKDQLRTIIERYNAGSISAEELAQLEQAIELGEVALNQLHEVRDMNERLDFTVPDPSPKMSAEFYENLGRLKSRQSPNSMLAGLTVWLSNLGLSQSSIRIAYAMILVVIGFGIGQWTGTSAPEDKIDALSSQVSEMRELMMLTLIKEPVATERLRAVNLVNETQQVDDKIIEALLNTLNYDENANVRLATVDALLRYVDNPVVRKGLIEAIPNQDNSMLQYSLAEAMLLMQEKSSVLKLKELLEKGNIEPDVKSKVEETIEKLS